MYLPPELVKEIVSFILWPSHMALCEPGVSTKRNWSSIEPLTLACKTYRALSLDSWFRTVFVRNPMDIEVLQSMFPEIGDTPRELHCVQPNTRKTLLWDLRGLRHIYKLRLDWLSPSVMPHYGSKDSADRLPFKHVSPTVKELDLRGLPWPSPVVFHNIHAIFPALNILRLRQHRIWCGLCHTCCIAKFSSPGPERIIYEGGSGLPMHYARALYSLKDLCTVSLTIADFGGGQTTLKDDDEHNRYLWAGECDRCMGIMYEDNTFRDQWVARKNGIPSAEKEPPQMVYVAPPSLKRVEWNFWREDGSEEVDVQESGEESSEPEDDGYPFT